MRIVDVLSVEPEKLKISCVSKKSVHQHPRDPKDSVRQ